MKVTLSKAEAEALVLVDPREAAGWNALHQLLNKKSPLSASTEPKKDTHGPYGWPKTPEGKSKGGREKVW